MRKELKLSELLFSLEEVDWFLDVYIKVNSQNIFKSLCLIINDEEEALRDSSDEPLYPKEQGVKLFLSISHLQDVQENCLPKPRTISQSRLAFLPPRCFHKRKQELAFGITSIG